MMSASSQGWVTLDTAKKHFLAGWRDALKWPLLRWLSPVEPVRLLKPDGADKVLCRVRNEWRAGRSKLAAIRAVELPNDMLLVRTLVLPSLAEEDLRRVVAGEVAKLSPFPAANTAYGFQSTGIDGGRLRVTCAVAAKDQIQAYLRARLASAAKHLPEVWAPGESGLLLEGFGEGRRARRLRAFRALFVGLLLSGAVLCAAILATPAMQVRLRAIEAVHAYERLSQVSAPQVRLREDFQHSAGKLEEAVRLRAMPVEPLMLIEDLSKLLSDEEWVSELRIQGNTVRMTGEAANASKLLQTLGEQPGFREVKALGTSVKIGNRETFSFEFKVDAAAGGGG